VPLVDGKPLYKASASAIDGNGREDIWAQPVDDPLRRASHCETFRASAEPDHPLTS